MEETLTDCLVRVREDLSNLSKVRNYLDTNGNAQEQCIVTWRTIETFNSILGVCSAQNTPQTDALDTLLDSFYHLARNNTDPGVWNDFGFELGIICVKVLSAIEKSEIFETLFCKLLRVINVVCEHNSSIWKPSARQILNIFINKKFSLSYFETVLKLYICILRNIDSFELCNFSSQNFHLLKTFSLLVQRVGDFEIQSDIMEFVFLYLSNKTESMRDFFATTERKLFESLQFKDFEVDCRTYLNAVNKPRGGFERKVYSVCCHTLYLGGCYAEPAIGASFLWVDANKETERLTIRCADFESESNRVVCISFSDILRADLSSEKSEGIRCLTIQTKSLGGLQFDVKSNDICLMIKNGEDLLEFVNFLKGEIKRKHKFDRKLSKTRSSLFIDRKKMQDVQDNAITSSEKSGAENILSDFLNLFEKTDPTTAISEAQFKSSQSSRILTAEIKSPPRSQKETIVVPSQELSPNSFVESLNQHIGRDSPDIPRTFEDSVETIDFLQKTNSAPQHKLFRSPDKVFVKTEQQHFSFIFDKDKENKLVVEAEEPNKKTFERKAEKPKQLEEHRSERVLRDRKSFEAKLTNTQSQDYFRQGSVKKKKPSLPKFKRSAKARNQEVGNEEKRERESAKVELGELKELRILEIQRDQKANRIENVNRSKERQNKSEEQRNERKTKWEFSGEKKTRAQPQRETKPSLLDPNGYAFKRWCTPTTSERSNFWLKKLNAEQKSKTDSDKVFDFSDDSNSISTKSKKRKRRVIHSKRKCRTREPKQTSFREVKEILRKTSPKDKQTSSLVSSNLNKNSPRRAKVSKSPESCPDVHDDDRQRSECGSKCISSPESMRRNDTEESDLQSEDEKERMAMKKRERSDEESSRTKTHKKKKPKTVLLSGKLLSNLRRRLQRKVQQDRQQTEEIVQTVSKAVGHLFNHLQRKEGRNVVSYLRAAEGAAAAVESDVGGLGLRARRIQRAMLYFQAGCSVSDACESVEGHFSGVRAALKDLSEKKDVSKTIARVSDRLESLIKSGIEKSIDNEMATRRQRLLKCASIFVGDCGDFP